ncbi:hypothetical protein QOT17_012275 [Balamuthia mandrillaris]
MESLFPFVSPEVIPVDSLPALSARAASKSCAVRQKLLCHGRRFHSVSYAKSDDTVFVLSVELAQDMIHMLLPLRNDAFSLFQLLGLFGKGVMQQLLETLPKEAQGRVSRWFRSFCSSPNSSLSNLFFTVDLFLLLPFFLFFPRWICFPKHVTQI